MSALQAPTNLRCEYHVNPLGIDVARPRLSWEITDPRRGARQTAYQVIVSAFEAKLDSGGADLWDSGKIAGDRSAHVAYDGPPLPSRRRCFWRVRTWDIDDNPSPWSETAWWEMGLLQRDDWEGEWIGSALVGAPRASVPCPYLRHTFTVDKPVASARLYATALGLYECHLNSRRVGEDIFTPGWTDYRKRVQYQVYDVTDLLADGPNALGAVLGDGWYCGHVGGGPRQGYGDRPKLLAQLEIRYADGTTQTVATDSAWNTSTGPLVESDMLMGESYDARLEIPGWCEASFDDSHWQPAEVFDDPGAPLVAGASPRVRRTQELRPIAPPKEPRKWGQRIWLVDLGQNMVGRIRLKVHGKAGTTVQLRYGETLDADEKLYTENLRGARATDYYTLRGADEAEVYEPTFTFHGFRYVEMSVQGTGLEGIENGLPSDTLTGVVLHSDTPPTGEFECSDELLNQLQRNITWGQRGNFLEVPTDCPQRDERLGWTGDAQVFVRTASFNMDVAGFFTKWQQDLADSQSERGEIPPVSPNTNIVGADGGPGWADAAVICPWTIYLCYGDTRLLEQHYESMVRFMTYLETTHRDFIRCYEGYERFGGFGDWLSINADTPKDLIGTAFFAYSAGLMARISDVLGKKKEAKRFRKLRESVREAFNRRFVTPGGRIACETQTGYILALHFDLLPEALRPAAAEALVADVKRRGDHISAGFLGSPYIQHVLTRAGRNDVAYRLLAQKTWPSWLYPVTQGATTIWERWDGWTHDKGFQDAGMNSFNHYAYGAIGDWLYAVVAGIDIDPAAPAYKRIRLHPRPGGKLTSARAALKTIHGRVESAWRIEGDEFHLDVTVPANTTASLRLPADNPASVTEHGQLAKDVHGVRFVEASDGEAAYELLAGRYAFRSKMPK
jgi:alpha-L-rhamnosidase